MWARVYGFPRGKGEGWVGRRDGFQVGKFRTDPDPKDGFHPWTCRNPGERSVLKFILPILSPEKPRFGQYMANTLYGAMSGARPVNWGKLIHQYVEKSIPHIGRKPSYLSPYILHLYQHYDCFTGEDEDLWTIAADEVVYKLGPETEMAETGTEDSSNHAVRKHLPSPPHP